MEPHVSYKYKINGNENQEDKLNYKKKFQKLSLEQGQGSERES